MKNVLEELYFLEGERAYAEERKHFKEDFFRLDSYEKLRATLDETQQKLLETLCHEIDSGWVQEVEIYYRIGVKTGFSFAQELL